MARSRSIVDRDEMLIQVIDEFNQNSGWNRGSMSGCNDAREIVTEMLVFGGRKSGRRHIFFELYGEGRNYEVMLPVTLRKQIWYGDTFLMTLKKGTRGWKLLFCSHPYCGGEA